MTDEMDIVNNLLPLAGECEERGWYITLLKRKDEIISLKIAGKG